MIFQPKQNRHGFTLVELTIVLGVFAAIVAALWSLVSIARQKARVEQAVEAITIVADGVRSLYGSQTSITFNYPVMTPNLVAAGIIPVTLVHKSTSSCAGGAATYYADTPWSAPYDACGTFNVCGWVVGGPAAPNKTNTACDLPAPVSAKNPSQFFAINFDYLDKASCIDLATAIYPTHPAGLVDVSIGPFGAAGTSAVAAGGGIPVNVSWASTACRASNTNRVVFIYRLRPPVS